MYQRNKLKYYIREITNLFYDTYYIMHHKNGEFVQKHL